MSLAKYSIGTKIFGAFVAMSMIVAAMGLAGYGVLSAAGNIAVTTFDGPLMAISYARGAHTDFTEMQVLEGRFEQARPEDRATIAADLAAVQPDHAAYWLLMQAGMILGFLTSYPANSWLIRRGIKEGM